MKAFPLIGPIFASAVSGICPEREFLPLCKVEAEGIQEGRGQSAADESVGIRSRFFCGDLHNGTMENNSNTVLKDLVIKDREEDVESIRVGALLTLSIGILNACTYVTRGHVFASSQSGNLLYLGLDFAKGDFSHVGKYLFPPLMFAIGIIIAEHYHDKPHYPQWRRVPFFIEIALITAATFLPDSWNALANPVFGLCCGLQTITFRKIRSTPVATVFINGSFQNSIVHAIDYLHLREREDAFRSLLYLIIVICYLGGIIIGGLLCPLMDHFVSLICSGLLLICTTIALPKPAPKKEEAKKTDK